ncbi:hypothetical protein [Sphingomonas bacterium]|uniref:hypothetical protein n=1 Tax=Sphingomonas bacterium TaxID=1895847 RepID=UPI00157658C7|nr:hypothetical protein [Sphingomonas bacterium]
MTLKSRWQVNGRKAIARDLAAALALARQHRAKAAKTQRETASRDADARAVARAIRRAQRDLMRGSHSISCRPAKVSGQRKGSARLRRFETMTGLVNSLGNRAGGGRSSSFHLKFTGRGLGNHRRAKDSPYKRGEAVRAVQYILRELAREIEGGTIISNISADPDAIAGLFAALEELEVVAGRANANVYTTLVVSLPHELDSLGRERLLTRICEPLAQRGLPYVGVPHRPDPEGDPRNFHGHVVLSWRPFETRADGEYGISSSTRAELNDAEFITEFRAHVATVMNEAMIAAGQARRFTPLSRAARGEPPVRRDQGKSTAGRKHHERRRDNIDRGSAELAWADEAKVVRAALAETAGNILVRDLNDRQQRIERLLQAESLLAPRKAASAGQMDQGTTDGVALHPVRQAVPDPTAGTAEAQRSDLAAKESPALAIPTSPVSHAKPEVSSGQPAMVVSEKPAVGSPLRAFAEVAPLSPASPSRRSLAPSDGANGVEPTTGTSPVSEPTASVKGSTKTILPVTPSEVEQTEGPASSVPIRTLDAIGRSFANAVEETATDEEQVTQSKQLPASPEFTGPIGGELPADGKRKVRKPVRAIDGDVRDSEEGNSSPVIQQPGPGTQRQRSSGSPERSSSTNMSHLSDQRSAIKRNETSPIVHKTSQSPAITTEPADLTFMLKEIVKFYRTSPDYMVTSLKKRDEFDALLQKPLNLIANRRIALRSQAGDLEIWVDSRWPKQADKAVELVRRLADHPLGYQVLMSAANNLKNAQSELIAMPWFKTTNQAAKAPKRQIER